MNLISKALLCLAPLLLSACVTVKMDHVVRDTAEVGKNAYKSLAAKWDSKSKAKTANVISHSYLGTNSQTVIEVKQLCEAEAVAKLRTLSGLAEVRYTLIENDIVTINGGIAANCKVGMDKAAGNPAYGQ